MEKRWVPPQTGFVGGFLFVRGQIDSCYFYKKRQSDNIVLFADNN